MQLVVASVNESVSLARLSDFGERTYWRMAGVADDWGRLSGDAGKVRACCLARVNCSDEQVEAAIEELIGVGRIEVYLERGILTTQLIDHERYLPSETRRRLNLRNRVSGFPAKTPASVVRHEASMADAHEGALAGARDSERTPTTEKQNPQTIAADAAKKRGRRRDPAFEALLEACGIEAASLTASGRGAANRALRELKEVGADADEIRRRAAIYRRRYDLPLTPSALAKHWGALSVEVASGRGVSATEALAQVRRAAEVENRELSA